ncbi:putative cell wall anchored protein, partial [Morchella snyderi]
DPIVNFCRRIWHSSVVRDEVLYINGGLQSYSNINSTTGQKYGNLSYGVNEYVIRMDLTATWSWRNTTSPISLIRKNTSSETPPNLSRGAFYAGPSNGTKLYTYGGTVDSSLNSSWDGFQRPTSNQYALWSYDLNNGNWAHENTTSDTTLIRPASGASAEASELGLGFWFNGEQDNGTSSESNDLWNTVKFLKGMIVLDFNTGEARNISTSAVSDLARTRGEMVYIPGVGESGILVLMGGGEKGADYEDGQEYGTLVSMAQVEIFDVASLYNQSTPNGTWYSQRATGDIPNARVDFCLVVASAPDGSSHNIYMHGGRGTSGDYYDDIHVLSIPSFTWTKIYSGTAYRYGMKCHLAGNRQMITVGGSQEGSWTDNCDWEYRSIAFYDMSTTEWGPTFFADAAPYQVPRRIIDVIGGNGNGSASLIAPTSGFQDTALYSLFPNSSDGQSGTGTATGVPVDPSSPSSSSSSSNTGAIAGGVIGGLAGIAVIGAAIFFFRRRRRHQTPAAPAAPAYTAQ